MHWSKRRHVSYKECPRRFFYEAIAAPQNRKIAELAEQQGGPLLRHSVVRDIILGLVNARDAAPPDLESLVESAREILTRGLEDEVEIGGQLSIVEQCLGAFLEQELPDIRKAAIVYVSPGDPVEFAYGGQTMMAAPEVVLRRDGGLEIICYRTGGSDFRKGAESHLRAGGLTAWARGALRYLDGAIQVTEVYLREDCLRFETTFTDDELRRFVGDAKETARAYSASAKIRDFPARPDYQGCRFCNFQSICPEWQDFAEVDYDLAALRANIEQGEPQEEPLREERDVFLCHVGAEKETTAGPTYRALEAASISAWLDEAEILFGDSIVRRVQAGLRSSRFLLCFISDAFIDRGWPEAEMEAALTAELSNGEPRVLPVIVGDPEPILRQYPLLGRKRHYRWSDGLAGLVEEIQRVLERERRNRSK